MPTTTTPAPVIDQKKLNELKDKFEKTYGKLNTEEGRKKFANTVEKMTVNEFNKIKEFNEDNPNITKFLSDFEIYFQKDREGNVVRFKKPRELQDEFTKAYKTVLKRHKDYEERTEGNSKKDEVKVAEVSPKESFNELPKEKKVEKIESKNYQEATRVQVSNGIETLKSSSVFSNWPLLGAIVIFAIIVGIFWKWIKK